MHYHKDISLINAFVLYIVVAADVHFPLHVVVHLEHHAVSIHTALTARNAFPLPLLMDADVAAALSIEGVCGTSRAFDERIHLARGQEGQLASAANLRALLAGAPIVASHRTDDARVQDAYSMRSSPQVLGAAHDALAFATRQVEIELNGVGDNPVFLPDQGLTLTGANFQGTPVSLPMEMIGTALSMVSVHNDDLRGALAREGAGGANQH